MIQENWLQTNWRSLAAIVYLIICLMDFSVMPFLMFLWHEPLSQIAKDIVNLPPDVQKAVLDKSTIFWSPITLTGMALFHVAFGSILGISAWGKSAEVVEETKQKAITQRAMVAARFTENPNMVKDRQ